VRVGTIAIRSGNPADIDPWAWSCGFYPGSHPREYTSGTAAAFDQARAAFEAAWRVFLSKRTEPDFQEWREQRDWTARKYGHVGSWRTVAVAAARPASCGGTCGESFDSHRLIVSLIHVPHLSAAHEIRRTEPLH
jgi:hypothetical protein